MQIVHVTLYSGEGKEALKTISSLKEEIDYKLIESKTGDLLIINLFSGNTDKLLDRLTSRFDFEHGKERSLIIFTPDTVIPRDIKKQSSYTARESLLTFAQDKSEINLGYLLMVIFSAVIITLGLILDNVAVIVGGMVVAPVLGPILAITIGIMLADISLIKKGLLAEGLAIIMAILIGFLFGSIIPNVELNNSLQIRMYPTLADLLIALSAGAAGAYILVKEKIGTGLVGVMVAASLLPVMCTIGIGLSLANPTMILGPVILLLGNYFSLFLANIIVFYFTGLRPQIWYKNKANKFVKRSLILIIIAVIILSVPLGILTIYQFYVEKPVAIIKTTIRENLVSDWNYRVDKIEIKGNLIDVYLYAEKDIEETDLYTIKHKIEKRLAKEFNINFKVIPIYEIKT